MRFLLFFAMVFVLFSVAEQARAIDFTVNKFTDDGDGTCNTPGTGDGCTLREAIAAATSNAGNDGVGFDPVIFATPQTIVLDAAKGPLVMGGNSLTTFYGSKNVIISGNNTTTVFHVTGGHAFMQSLTIIDGKGSASTGGGVRVTGGTASLIFCTVSHNVGGNGIIAGKGGAGGISVEGGNLILSATTVAYNTGGNGATGADGGPGGIAVLSGQATITNSTIANNTGGTGSSGNFGSANGGDGGTGGIFNNVSFTVSLSTLAFNTGGNGGARGKTSGTAGIPGGGGVGNELVPFTINHSIISHNQSGGTNPVDSDVNGRANSTGYNILGNNNGSFGITHATDLVNVDPLFDPDGLDDNQGQTLTIALQNGSPGIDSGDPELNPQVYLFDQRGLKRIAGPRVDRGAVEEQKTKVSINDVSIQEGNSGTRNLIFTITASPATSDTIVVSYETSNGSAVAGSDYNAVGNSTQISAGTTSVTVAVPIKGDTDTESNETFFVNLTSSSNSEIIDRQAVGTITNDDAGPSLSINDATITEGNSGAVNATFTVTLSQVSAQTVTVNAIPTNGTARAPGDYTSGGTTLSFAPGQLTKTVSVAVQGDLLDEINEVFYVLLSTSNNAIITRGRGVGTIVDNDAPPSITIDNLNIGEGNSGQRVASFRLNLSAPSGQVVRVSYATAPGTTLPATAGNDYVAVAPTQIAFNVGSSIAYARVLLNGDVLNEKDETFLVNLSAPVNATIGDGQAIGTILNDDSAPALAINSPSIAEGNSGTKNLVFTVTLSKSSGQTITVNYATADGAARSTSDYAAQSGSLSFPPGTALTRTIAVPINGDVLAEGNETFFVLLSGAINASVGTARGTGTITNDDVSG